MLGTVTQVGIGISRSSEVPEFRGSGVPGSRIGGAPEPKENAKLDVLTSLLDELLEETGGPLTPAERKAADRALDGTGLSSSSASEAVLESGFCAEPRDPAEGVSRPPIVPR